MEFSKKEYWSGSHSLLWGNLPTPEIEPRSPALQMGSLPSAPLKNPPTSSHLQYEKLSTVKGNAPLSWPILLTPLSMTNQVYNFENSRQCGQGRGREQQREKAHRDRVLCFPLLQISSELQSVYSGGNQHFFNETEKKNQVILHVNVSLIKFFSIYFYVGVYRVRM